MVNIESERCVCEWIIKLFVGGGMPVWDVERSVMTSFGLIRVVVDEFDRFGEVGRAGWWCREVN